MGKEKILQKMTMKKDFPLKLTMTRSFFETSKVLNIKDFELFLEDLSTLYLANPYHNFIHACDVAENCAFILDHLIESENTERIKSDEIKALLILVSLGHDILHPGYNPFSGTSSLEEISADFFCTLLDKHFPSLSGQKENATKMIINTDISIDVP